MRKLGGDEAVLLVEPAYGVTHQGGILAEWYFFTVEVHCRGCCYGYLVHFLRGEKLHFSLQAAFGIVDCLKYRCTPFGSRICVDVYIQRFQSRVAFYGSGEHYQKSLACDGGYTVECGADADVE